MSEKDKSIENEQVGQSKGDNYWMLHKTVVVGLMKRRGES